MKPGSYFSGRDEDQAKLLKVCRIGEGGVLI